MIVHSGVLVPVILQHFNDPSCSFMLRKELLYSITNLMVDKQCVICLSRAITNLGPGANEHDEHDHEPLIGGPRFLPLFVDDATATTVLSMFHIPDTDGHRLALDYIESVLKNLPNVRCVRHMLLMLESASVDSGIVFRLVWCRRVRPSSCDSTASKPWKRYSIKRFPSSIGESRASQTSTTLMYELVVAT